MSLIDYKIVEALPSSFVFGNLKLKGDKGNGEAKLHIGSKTIESELDIFFNYFEKNDICRFDRSNLLRYMDQVKIEYIYEKINRYRDINLDYWNEKVKEIYELQDSDFNFKLEKIVDSRYYIRGYEDIFRSMFRKIALPLITNIKIEKHKNSNDSNYIYLFLLELNVTYLDKDRSEEKEIPPINRQTFTVKYNDKPISNSSFTMTEVPYRIIEHYIKNNKNLNFNGLKEAFKNCKSGNAELILEADKVNPTRTGDYLRPDTRSNLVLDDIEFGVYTQWRANGPGENFSRYKKSVKDELGYTVEATQGQENENLIGINKIYFGSPGTGKSRHVNIKYYDDLAKRVTFHPEYTYSDFIGYIKPVDEGEEGLTYKFIPGTFTEILVEALNNPNSMYSLIIEELNRANTAAVFGDLFQLLDRDSTGFSEYSVNSPEIYKYIKGELGEDYDIENGSIYIPNNLNIIATMNTADQNVFVMDTAFKRRWRFEYLPVEFKDDHHFKDNLISGLNVKWIDFVTTVNDFMMSEENDSLMISEDKQIGQYFIRQEELKDTNIFGYKVLLYLWDDVFKMDRQSIFESKIRTFSDLMNIFSKGNSMNIFSSNIKEQLNKFVYTEQDEV